MKREEALKWLKRCAFSTCEDCECEYMPAEWCDKQMQEAVMAIEALSAEAVQGWIPCSERLPSMRIEVIYSLDGYVGTGYMTDRDYNGEKIEPYWEDIESGVTIEPIAWMPLPTPYKGGDKE